MSSSIDGGLFFFAFTFKLEPAIKSHTQEFADGLAKLCAHFYVYMYMIAGAADVVT